MALSFTPIRPLLQTGTNAWSRWFSYIGLGIGVLLLLCAVQMYINLQQITKEGNLRKNGYDYIPIAKNVTAELMRRPEKNMFTDEDIKELKSQPFIESISPLIANQFRIQLSAGSMLPFTTELFLESLDNDFLDTLPSSFSWQEGQEEVPIIFSSDFFEIYMVFAQGQDLPQFSKETATGIRISITCYGNGQEKIFIGKIVAFSDRVNSILVPKNFLERANETFGPGKVIKASRVFIKTKDANNPDLIKFLDAKGYEVNREKTLLGRNKMVIQNILSGLGVFGLLVVILAVMLFSFYLQLVIAKSKDNLQLLMTLGYSPHWLSKMVAGKFIPVYVIVILIALTVTQILQWGFHQFILHTQNELSSIIHWALAAVALLLILLIVFTNYRMVKKILYNFYKQSQ
ncbi:MAG TPA: FtsX-like permease family protein [Chitinophagaceae bacterium]|nr:FtsX-like permease family protein [Chitinophagaceae bacterium]